MVSTQRRRYRTGGSASCGSLRSRRCDLGRDFRFARPRWHLLYTREPPSARNPVRLTIVQLQRPSPQPTLTWNRPEPLLSGHFSDTAPHWCPFFASPFVALGRASACRHRQRPDPPQDLVEVPPSAATAAVRCPRVRADRSPADRAAVPPASAPLRRKRAVAHDVEAQFSTGATPALGAGHPVDRVHRSSVPGGNPRFSPKISEVKATDQQRPAQAPGHTLGGHRR